jgi:DMSO/TMAO reductase YedYZ molybdopterin-dependent catalytic subunit
VSDFPVLSAGPTPQIATRTWEFAIEGLVRQPTKWSWDQFLALPAQDFVVDICCVTTWTKLDTRWRGVNLDVLLEHTALEARAQFVTALCYGGYTTNVPLPDVLNGQAFVAYAYDGK